MTPAVVAERWRCARLCKAAEAAYAGASATSLLGSERSEFRRCVTAIEAIRKAIEKGTRASKPAKPAETGGTK